MPKKVIVQWHKLKKLRRSVVPSGYLVKLWVSLKPTFRTRPCIVTNGNGTVCSLLNGLWIVMHLQPQHACVTAAASHGAYVCRFICASTCYQLLGLQQEFIYKQIACTEGDRRGLVKCDHMPAEEGWLIALLTSALSSGSCSSIVLQWKKLKLIQ
jgi:hypothetical protein